ncbi:MAG: hypothetical protein R3E91_00775 [Chlamydiales bacterium]
MSSSYIKTHPNPSEPSIHKTEEVGLQFPTEKNTPPNDWIKITAIAILIIAALISLLSFLSILGILPSSICGQQETLLIALIPLIMIPPAACIVYYRVQINRLILSHENGTQ